MKEGSRNDQLDHSHPLERWQISTLADLQFLKLFCKLNEYDGDVEDQANVTKEKNDDDDGADAIFWRFQSIGCGNKWPIKSSSRSGNR